MMVLMIGLHSMLEYPLWYAYFLLPTAWAWGAALRQTAPAQEPGPTREAGPAQAWATRLAGALLVGGSLFALFDYRQVVVIFTASDGPLTLAQRIERGQQSVFFAHHADYAAATTTEPPSAAMGAFSTATHALLDTRLMIAWARALNESGHRDRARNLVARLREFRNPDAKDFLSECELPLDPGLTPPFQCLAVGEPVNWRAYRSVQP